SSDGMSIRPAPGGRSERELLNPRGTPRCNPPRDPPAEGSSNHIDPRERQVIEQVQVMKDHVLHRIDVFNTVGLCKPRMSGRDDSEFFGERFVKTEPEVFAIG